MTDAKKHRFPRVPFPLTLALVTALCFALFLICGRFDNKYTAPRPSSTLAVTRLEPGWRTAYPAFYLVEGWEFYQNKLLTPEEISANSPDAHFYIGRYGGFDLGDPDASPHGDATYRAVILTDGVLRDYALELPEIFSRWRLWVNGVLLQSVGTDWDGATSPASSMVTFAAADKIEIVVAVSDDSHFYSGLVYPPAFGTPEAVAKKLSARLLIHGAACAAAVFIGLLCLLVGIGYRFTRPYGALFLLCLCFCGATAWPIFQALGLRGDLWPLLERFCRYGIFLVLVWIQARLCRLPKVAAWPALIAGTLVCLSILVQPSIPAARAGSLYVYGAALGLWKWLCAAWLLGTSAWALWRGRRYSKPLLAGGCIFAAALVAERLTPMHEPILLGWYVEIAGFLLILLIAGILWRDTVQVYRESLALKEQKRLADFQLAARADHAALQQEYVRRAREHLHESRSRLTLIRHYVDRREIAKLERYLDGILETAGVATAEHTGNPLVDAILTVQLDRAEARDIYVELEADPLPNPLPIPDGDITSLLLNLLDNAVEGCERVPTGESRWIHLCLGCKPDRLIIECRNAAIPEDGAATSKADKQAHGFGLGILRELAARHSGTLDIRRGEDSYRIQLELALDLNRQRESCEH